MNNNMIVSIIDSMGIYPASVTEDGVTTKRTKWQEGYNAAIIEIFERIEDYTIWKDSLSPSVLEDVSYLTDKNILIIDMDEDGKIYLSVCVNDTFYYAADTEDIDIEDVPEVASLYRRYDYYGMAAWVSIKRGNMKLIEKCGSPSEFDEALCYLKTVNQK